MKYSPSLGHLCKIPREVRLDIWRHVVASGWLLPSCLTSREFRDEIYDIFWRPRSIRFDIDPRTKVFRRHLDYYPEDGNANNFTLTMFDDDLELETELEIKYYGGGFQCTTEPALQVPFHWLKAIDIDVVAPDRDLPAELVVVWAMILSFVEHFVETHLPHVRISFIDDPVYNSTWGHDDGSLHRSFDVPCEFTSGAMESECSDLELAMTQFRRLSLQAGKNLSISLPAQGEKDDRIQDLVRTIQLETASNGKRTPQDICDDFAESQQNGWAMYLDLQLDILSGDFRRHNMVRWMRFDNIRSEYFSNMHERIRKERGRAGVSKHLLDAATFALEYRHAALLAYKPWAHGNPKLYDQSQILRRIDDVEFRWNGMVETFAGVPSFTSDEFKMACFGGFPAFGCEENHWRVRRSLRIDEFLSSEFSNYSLGSWRPVVVSR